MDEPEVERLLRERARRVAPERALSEAAERAARSELTVLATEEIAREERSRRRWLIILPVAAAAILLLWLEPWKSSRYGRAEIELTLLDESRRPLERVVRGWDPAVSPGEVDTISIELFAVQTAYVALFVWGADGDRRELDAGVGAIAAETDRFVTLDLAHVGSRPGGEAVVNVVAVSSKRPVPSRRLEALLPETIEAAGREGRDRRLRGACVALERELDCAAEIATFVIQTGD